MSPLYSEETSTPPVEAAFSLLVKVAFSLTLESINPTFFKETAMNSTEAVAMQDNSDSP